MNSWQSIFQNIFLQSIVIVIVIITQFFILQCCGCCGGGSSGSSGGSVIVSGSVNILTNAVSDAMSGIT